jgi:hypothetical protein
MCQKSSSQKALTLDCCHCTSGKLTKFQTKVDRDSQTRIQRGLKKEKQELKRKEKYVTKVKLSSLFPSRDKSNAKNARRSLQDLETMSKGKRIAKKRRISGHLGLTRKVGNKLCTSNPAVVPNRNSPLRKKRRALPRDLTRGRDFSSRLQWPSAEKYSFRDKM